MLLYLKQRHYKKNIHNRCVVLDFAALRACTQYIPGKLRSEEQVRGACSPKGINVAPIRLPAAQRRLAFLGDVKASGFRRDSVCDIVEGGAANPAVNGYLKKTN